MSEDGWTISPRHTLDPSTASVIFGPDPLEGLAPRFESKRERFAFYAQCLAAAYPPKIDMACQLCRDQTPIEGFVVLVRKATVTVYWVRIILISVVFLPLIVIMLLLPVGIIPHPSFKLADEVGLMTFHPICRGCWVRQGRKKAVSFILMVVTGFILALSFLTALSTAMTTVAFLARLWGYKPEQALWPAAIFLAAALLCVVGRFAMTKAELIAAPPHLRYLADARFRIFGADLVRPNKLAAFLEKRSGPNKPK